MAHSKFVWHTRVGPKYKKIQSNFHCSVVPNGSNFFPTLTIYQSSMTNWGPVNMLATHLDPKSADVKICPLVKSYIFGLFTGSTSSKSENQVKWCHHWIGLEKLPQKTPQMLKTVQWFKSYIFHLFRGHTASKSEIWSNLMSPLDWPRKHTPNRLLKCWNPSSG